MTVSFEEFFIPNGPERRANGNPSILPRGGTEKIEYTRASALADYIGDTSFLHRWEMRYLAKNLAQNMDLVRLAAAETYTTGLDKPTKRDELRANSASGYRLDEIVARALERGRIHEKADYGSAIHARTEPGNTGTDPDEMQQKDVEATWQLWSDLGVVHLGTEVFTANDELHAAGTFDHLSYIPGIGICVTDKKTSSHVSEADYGIQLADYANSDVYDWMDDSRMTLEEFVAAQGWDPALLRRDVGFIWWIKRGKCTMHRLDLNAGYQAAKVAAWVRDQHWTKPDPDHFQQRALKETERLRAELLTSIGAADSQDAILALWNRPEVRAIWIQAHTDAANARKEALAS